MFIKFLAWLGDRIEQWAIDGSDDVYYFNGECLIKVVTRSNRDYVSYQMFYMWKEGRWGSIPDFITDKLMYNLEEFGWEKIHWKEARHLIQFKL